MAKVNAPADAPKSRASAFRSRSTTSPCWQRRWVRSFSKDYVSGLLGRLANFNIRVNFKSHSILPMRISSAQRTTAQDSAGRRCGGGERSRLAGSSEKRRSLRRIP